MNFSILENDTCTVIIPGVHFKRTLNIDYVQTKSILPVKE